jgi:hypothetical protein
LHGAKFQKVFKTKYAVRQIAHRQSGNIGWLVGHFVFEALDLAVEMRTCQTHARTMGRVRRIPMGRPVQVQAGQDENFPAARLIFQAGAIPVAAFKIKKKLFPPIH